VARLIEDRAHTTGCLMLATRRFQPSDSAAAAAALLSVLVFVSAPLAATPSAVQAGAGALQRLAASLEGDTESVRADFAAVALGEILMAYELEFERLSVPGQVSRRELFKQARWAHALRAFLDEIYAARDELDAGASVEILVAPPAAVQLLVGSRVVPLSSPRIENPADLESDIVARYCESFDCDPMLVEDEIEETRAVVVHGGWSFRDGWGSTYETPDGLGFMFQDVRQRGAKERICKQLGEELRLLVTRLAASGVHGSDLRHLRVVPSGDGDDHRVVLSSRGHTLRLFLPALARAPGVVEVAREWIRARLEGRAYHQLFPRADLLLADLMNGPALR
jgi:hypothetical protein